jgi:hypothetical protein
VLGAAELGHGDGFPLQVADGTDPLRPKQLEAPDVDACEQNERVPRLHAQEKRPAEHLGDVNLTGDKSRHLFGVCLLLDVLHLGESLSQQEFFSDILGGHTEAGIPDQSEPRRLGWRLGGHPSG